MKSFLLLLLLLLCGALLLSVGHAAPCATLTCSASERCYFNTTTGVEACVNRCNVTSPQVCMHSGTCIGSINSSTCNCTGTNYVGNFCEYPTCWNLCNYLGTTACTGNATVGTCNCSSIWSGATCSVTAENTILYNYLVNLWLGDVPAMPVSYCNSTITNTVDSDNTLVVVCAAGNNITSLAFTKGAYEFPRTFVGLTKLAILSFTNSKLIRIDANIKYLPVSIRTLALINIEIPANVSALALTGSWGSAGAALTSFTCGSCPETTLGASFGSSLTAMATLFLSNVQGTLPASVWSMTHLRSLTAISGGLTSIGQAPASANWTLDVVELSDNELTGTFLALVSRLPSGGAVSLSAELNSLTGTMSFPASWETNLALLKLADNYMTGSLTLPSPTIVGNAMTTVTLSNNLFSCPIFNYSVWATTTDYSGAMATACTACNGTCAHGGTCSMTKVLDPFTQLCVCAAGFYGPNCLYTKAVYVDLYNLNPDQYNIALPFCNNTNVECDASGNVVGLVLEDTDLAPTFPLYTSHVTSLTLTGATTELFTYLPPNLVNYTLIECEFDNLDTTTTGLSVASLLRLVIEDPASPSTFYLPDPVYFPNLVTYSLTSSASFGVDVALPRSMFNHPTLQEVFLSGGGWGYIEGAALQENSVLEQLTLTSPDRLPFPAFSLADLLAVIPAMPNLRVLNLEDFLATSTVISTALPASFAKIFPSESLNLQGCMLGGGIPTLLSSKKATLQTLLLDGNDGWTYPVANYSSWATTTDFSTVFAAVNTSCERVTCTDDEKCTATGNCFTPAKLLGVKCLNSGTIGPAPSYACQCTVGYSGPNCGFPNPQQAKIYEWARKAQYVKLYPRTTLCTQAGISCISNSVSELTVTGMNGPFLMPEDMEGLPVPNSLIFNGYATNPNEFFMSGITVAQLGLNTRYTSSLLSSDWNLVVTNAVVFGDSGRPELIDKKGDYVIGCDLLSNAAGVGTVGSASFNFRNCSDITPTTVYINSGGFINVATYDQISAYLPTFSDPDSYVALGDDVGPVGTASYQFNSPVAQLIVGDPNLMPYSSQMVAVKRTSFYNMTYDDIETTSNSFLCPVYDFSLIASDSNYDYGYGFDKYCVFCRAVSCTAGQYCNPHTATCQATAAFCAFEQCQNGGTCNEADSSCTCVDGFGGSFCEIEYTCTCENDATCNADGTCHCPPGFRGDRCQTRLSDGGIAGIVIGTIVGVVLVIGLVVGAASLGGSAGAGGAASTSTSSYMPMKTY